MSRSRRGSTQLAQVDTCERAWTLENKQGLVPLRPKKFLMRGSLIHTGLAYWWANQLPQKPSWFLEKPLQQALEEEGRGYPSLIGLALNVTASYAQTYGAPDPTWDPVFVEHEFEAPALDVVGSLWANSEDAVTAKPDLLVLDRATQRLLMVDHKSGAPKEGNEYELSWQFNYYRLVVEACLGRQIDGVVVQTVKTDREGHRCSFDRVEVPLNRHLDEEVRGALARRVEREKQLLDGHYPHPNFGPHSCFGRYGPCDYRPVCLSPPAQRQRVLETEYKRRTEP